LSRHLFDTFYSLDFKLHFLAGKLSFILGSCNQHPYKTSASFDFLKTRQKGFYLLLNGTLEYKPKDILDLEI